VAENKLAGPVEGEISTHLKWVVFFLLRLGQSSAACNFSGIEVDGGDAPHLRDRARQAKSPVETSVGVEKHFKLAASVFQPPRSSLKRSE